MTRASTRSKHACNQHSIHSPAGSHVTSGKTASSHAAVAHSVKADHLPLASSSCWSRSSEGLDIPISMSVRVEMAVSSISDGDASVPVSTMLGKTVQRLISSCNILSFMGDTQR